MRKDQSDARVFKTFIYGALSGSRILYHIGHIAQDVKHDSCLRRMRDLANEAAADESFRITLFQRKRPDGEYEYWAKKI